MNILTPGIIQVTGAHDTGKTRFALECGADPAKTIFIDDDIKGRATVAQAKTDGIEFARYIDFVSECRGSTLLDVHKAGIALIDSLPNGLHAIVWDTWTRFAATFKPYVTANPNEFRSPKEWPAMAQMKGATQWQEAQFHEAAILNKLQDKAKVVILITHLKDDYQGNQKTGKRIPASSRTLNRVPVMRLWLMHTPGSPVPSALVLKRINRNKLTKRGLRTVNILPRKIVPQDDDQSLWDTIARYYDKPMGNRSPTAWETPTADELAILDGVLTKEQQQTLRWSLKIAAANLEETEAAESKAEQDELTLKVKALLAKGKSPGAIAKRLNMKMKDLRPILTAIKGETE